jgi:hypothetical protein
MGASGTASAAASAVVFHEAVPNASTKQLCRRIASAGAKLQKGSFTCFTLPLAKPAPGRARGKVAVRGHRGRGGVPGA